VLGGDARDQAGHVRGGEAVARGDGRAAILPGDRHVDAPGAPLDRRRRVVEERLRIGRGVGGNREDRRERRRERKAGYVVDRADQRHVVEVGVVDRFVEEREQALALGRQAQVHDLCAPFDRPLEAGQEGDALAAQVGAENPH
jgi:hypothetical protein